MAPNDHQRRNPPHKLAFSTPPKELSLYSTLNLCFLFIFLRFNNGGVGGGVLLSWPKFFLFFDAQLVLPTDNGENDNYENCDSICDNKMSEGRCLLTLNTRTSFLPCILYQTAPSSPSYPQSKPLCFVGIRPFVPSSS